MSMSGAPLLAAPQHSRLFRVRRQRDLDVDDLCAPRAALDDSNAFKRPITIPRSR